MSNPLAGLPFIEAVRYFVGYFEDQNIDTKLEIELPSHCFNAHMAEMHLRNMGTNAATFLIGSHTFVTVKPKDRLFKNK